MGVSLKTTEELRKFNHDVVHLRDIGWQKKPDHEIIQKAKEDLRILLTFDLDFGQLLAASGDKLPSTMIFRLSDQTPNAVTGKILSVIKDQEASLKDGCIIIVEDKRYRVRKLPL